MFCDICKKPVRQVLGKECADGVYEKCRECGSPHTLCYSCYFRFKDFGGTVTPDSGSFIRCPTKEEILANVLSENQEGT